MSEDPFGYDAVNLHPNIGTSKAGSQTSLLRKAAFRLLGGQTFRRSASTPDGVFRCYVTPGAQLSVLNLKGLPVDPVHTGFIKRWVGASSIVWDIGGNMGLFGLPAALKASSGQVLMFEPDIDLVRNLSKTINDPDNRALHTRVLPIALSDEDGIAEFQIADFGRSMNKLADVGKWHDPVFVTAELRTVPTFKIDTLAASLPAPDVIKIDVEGAEMKVLRGGRKTIEQHRPVLLVEVPDSYNGPIVDYFSDLNYLLFDGKGTYDAPITTPVWDTVAVPRERFKA